MILALLLGPAAIGSGAVAAEQSPQTQAAAQRAAAEEEWLKTVWSEIDSVVQQQDYRLQETVTAGGVRGLEAEDALLRHYYYKGGRRYSARETLERVVARLEGQMGSRRRGVDRGKLKYLTALCSDMLGEFDTARRYYEDVVAHYDGTPYAARARQRLQVLRAQEP